MLESVRNSKIVLTLYKWSQAIKGSGRRWRNQIAILLVITCLSFPILLFYLTEGDLTPKSNLIGMNGLVLPPMAALEPQWPSTKMPAPTPDATPAPAYQESPPPLEMSSQPTKIEAEATPAQTIAQDVPTPKTTSVQSAGEVTVLAAPVQKPRLTAIGDSVLLGAAPQLQKLLPGIIIDSKVSRQMNQAQAVVDTLRAEGKLGSQVILELGTNGPFTKKQYITLLQSIHADQVFLINTRVPRPWEDEVNKTLQEIVDAVPNAVLIDWYSASSTQEGLQASDGIHLTPQGALFYANLIAQAVK